MKAREYIINRIKVVNMTMTEVSERMGYSATSGLSNMLQNPKRLNIEQITKLAEIIKVKSHRLSSRIAKD